MTSFIRGIAFTLTLFLFIVVVYLFMWPGIKPFL